MFELRHSETVKQGNFVIVTNPGDSAVLHEFLDKAQVKKIMHFITIGDIMNIIGKAKEIEEKNLTINIVQKNLEPKQMLKSVTAEISKPKGGEKHG